MLAAQACAQGDTPASNLARAQAALRIGAYDDARDLATRLLKADPRQAPALQLLVRADILSGHYAAAESAAAAFVATGAPGRDGLVPLGEVQLLRGRLVAAESSFTQAQRLGSADSLTAIVRLAQLQVDRGQITEAMRVFDRFIDIYNAGKSRLTSRDLEAVGVACRYLGRENSQLFKDALKAFDAAIAADSLSLDAKVHLAELFLDKYNSQDAKQTLDEVLKVNPRHPEALLAMARVRQFDGNGDATEYVRKSLEVNPVSSAAHALAALNLIDVERYDEAIAEAQKGLSEDSLAYEPLVALSAAYYLKGDSAAHRSTLQRALSRRPRSADAESMLSDIMARNRLYGEAVSFAKRAVARDDKASRALSFLGVNALRVGDIAGGRQYLEQSFALDPYDVWSKNTLDLLDTFKDYDEVKTRRLVFLVERKDAPLFSLYAGPLAEEAFDSLAARYEYRPAGPVRVEVYRSHADFSVRTVGLAGLGALGVSFGDVVAIDGPAARRPGEFNWGSTLWHELAHTFTLGASANKVPRWLSEGLSVYEERRARQGWGDDVSPSFLAAFKGGLLVSLEHMNDGFMRPRFAEQVILSYYQASLLCEMIERDRGIGAIRQLLAAYRQGSTSEAAMRSVLHMDLPELQRRFDAYVRERFGPQLEAVDAGKLPVGGHGVEWDGKFAEAMRTANALVEAKQWEPAARQLEQAKRLFPSFAGEESAYRQLARIALTTGDTARAIQELQAMTAINENAYAANRDLAGLLRATGNARGAAQAWDRAMYIYPQELEPHVQLADLAGSLGDHRTQVRERLAVLALDPTDRVEALYQVAVAYVAASEPASARRYLLQALELAPNFEKGQELLLRLRGPSGSSGDRNSVDRQGGLP
ncbi:MAG: tetratricopeptide repeat protein [Gemmatimonadaceae bacterium]